MKEGRSSPLPAAKLLRVKRQSSSSSASEVGSSPCASRTLASCQPPEFHERRPALELVQSAGVHKLLPVRHHQGIGRAQEACRALPVGLRGLELLDDVEGVGHQVSSRS
jgi:hypothetical protein